MDHVLGLEAITESDLARVGGKGALLGEMLRRGLPVPAGFVVTVEAFQEFFGAASARAALEGLKSLRPDDPEQVRAVAAGLQHEVRRRPAPGPLGREIVDAYRRLGAASRLEPPFVAVRSSAVVEDRPERSYAGMFRSFLNVRGDRELLHRLRECWASQFAPRVLAYRARAHAAEGIPPMAVVIQEMVRSEKAGVLLTFDPAHGDREAFVIESSWGLGEAVVGGQVQPDRFVVDKHTLEIRRRIISHKTLEVVLDPAAGENLRRSVHGPRADRPSLDEREVHALAELAERLDAAFGAPQVAEFAIAGERVYLVQTRPIARFIGGQADKTARAHGAQPLVRGLGASAGVAVGRVHVIRAPGDGELAPGEVLVAPMTVPDWVPELRRAAAIVTDSGGLTSHTALVARELGIPCLVGTEDATLLLANGREVVVDADAGAVFAAAAAPEHAPGP